MKREPYTIVWRNGRREWKPVYRGFLDGDEVASDAEDAKSRIWHYVLRDQEHAVVGVEYGYVQPSGRVRRVG